MAPMRGFAGKQDGISRRPQAKPQLQARELGGSRHSMNFGTSGHGMAHGILADAVRNSPYVAAQTRQLRGIFGAAHGGAAQSAAQPASPASTAVVQMVRTAIAAADPQAITVAALRAILAAVDVELGALEAGETGLGFIDLGRVTGWRNTADQRLNALAALNLGAAAYTWDQIQTQADATLQTLRQAAIPLFNARGALNKSKTEHEQYLAEMRSSEEQLAGYKDKERLEGYKDKEKGKRKEKPKEEPEETWEVGKYDHDLAGAIVLVEKPYVVVIEHYQLKHNSDLGVLSAGGPFKGETGSTLPGGWDAHVDTYAPEVLAFAKAEAEKHPDPKEGKTVILPKQRTSNIEAYITLVRYKSVWIVHYHGNPPK